MKLHVQCRKCRVYFDLKKSYLTRPDLIADIGEYFNLQCNHCFKNVRFHVNDVKAYKTASGKMIVNVFGIGVLVLVTMAFWDMGFMTNLGWIWQVVFG